MVYANNEEMKIVTFTKKFINEYSIRNSDVKVKERCMCVLMFGSNKDLDYKPMSQSLQEVVISHQG